MKLTLALALAPVWLMVGIVGLVAVRDLVGSTIAGAGVALLLLAVPVLALLAYVARANAVIAVTVDEDAFVQLAGVHPTAGTAIARAAGLEDQGPPPRPAPAGPYR